MFHYLTYRSFGSSGAHDVSRDMHADVGYAHAEVSKVELVVWPLKNRPSVLEMYPPTDDEEESGIAGVGMGSSNKVDIQDITANDSGPNSTFAQQAKQGELVVSGENKKKLPWEGIGSYIKELKIHETVEGWKEGVQSQVQRLTPAHKK